ncbi:MAG: Transcriptional regulatory protein SrrA [Chlamydiia bacterium]|nr:Transcriptional regulatory protein SrrA [Chlamydiia bacterium]
MSDTPIHKILLVDDDTDLLTITKMSLESESIEIETAGSGAEGIEKALSFQPDVILLDVMMPELDGIGTLERLKSAPSTQSIPVIFLTAKVQKSEVERYNELEVAGVISKPFSPNSLFGQITKLVNGNGHNHEQGAA